MTMPSEKSLEREKDKLYLLDSELIRRLGVPEKTMRSILPALESKYGFPKKQPLFGGRRYWPLVKAWLDKHNGLVDATAPPTKRKLTPPKPLRTRDHASENES
jgi:hypothetical protein